MCSRAVCVNFKAKSKIERKISLLAFPTDKEIFEAVGAKRAALDNLEINGGDDNDDNNVEIIEKPDRREVLAALFTFQRYISDIGDPFVHQLEAILASFGGRHVSRRLNPCGHPTLLIISLEIAL